MPKPVFNAFPLHFKQDDGYFDGDKGFTSFIYLHLHSVGFHREEK